MLQDEVADELAGAQEFVSANIRQEIVTADAERLRTPHGLDHAPNRLPFGTFDIQLEEMNLMQAELADDGVDRSGRDAETLGSPHSIAQVFL